MADLRVHKRAGFFRGLETTMPGRENPALASSNILRHGGEWKQSLYGVSRPLFCGVNLRGGVDRFAHATFLLTDSCFQCPQCASARAGIPSAGAAMRRAVRRSVSA